MRTLSLFLLAVFCMAVSFSWAYEDYAVYTVSSAPNVASSAYNEAQALREMTRMPEQPTNYNDLNRTINYPAVIDYQKMNLIMLNQQAKLSNYSLEETKKNEDMMIENTWGNTTVPAYAEQSTDQYNPAFNNTQGNK